MWTDSVLMLTGLIGNVARRMKPRLIRITLSGADMSNAGHADEHDDEEREDKSGGEPERLIPAEELFAGRREVWIDLDGVRYRLRITRRGKLILQK
jgi:hemin uptake protein HemP